MESLLTEVGRWVGGELLGEELTRGLCVPLWREPDLKYLAEKL